MDHETPNALETKAGIQLDAMVTHAEMMRAFVAFRGDPNHERLALSEKRAGDVVLDEKLERINAAMDAQARRLDEITLKAARPAFGGSAARCAAPRRSSTSRLSMLTCAPARAAACARSN